MAFTDLLLILPSGIALPTLHYDNEIEVATIEKILENRFVKSGCKQKICTKND